MMRMNTEYEIIIIYDSEYAEVIVFTSDRFMNSSNDIVSEAIRKGTYTCGTQRQSQICPRFNGV